MKKVIGKLHLFRDQIRRKLGMLFFDRERLAADLSRVQHILVVRWDAKLGDSYISSFFFREIKKLPNVRVTVITTPELKDLYLEGFKADTVLTMKKRPSYKDLKRIANEIAAVDLVVHLTEYMKMKDLYFLSQLDAPNVAAMDDEIKRVNIKMAQQTKDMLFHDKYVHLLKLLTVPDIDDGYIIPYRKEITEGRKQYDLVFNFFGSTEHKSVAVARASTTLKKVIEHYPNLNVGLLSSPNTLNKAQLIENSVNNSGVVVIDNVNTINDAVNVIADAKVVISVDTSIVHIAAGLKKPNLAIYPKLQGVFNPWLPPATEQLSVLFSPYEGINVDVNNYSDPELLTLLKRFLS